jgi:hypothetical protein
MVSQYVLLRSTALLHERPADDSPSMVAGAPAAAGEGIKAADLRVFRFAGQRNDWVAVDSLPYSAHHCYSAVEALRGMHLRFYVRPADLVRVTVRAETVHFPDGAAVALRSGTALANDPSRAGGHVAALDDFQVPVHLPPDAIGLRYALPDRDNPGIATSIADAARGLLTIRPGLLRNADGEILPPPDLASLPVIVTRGTARGTARVTYGTDHCGNYFTVVVPARAVRPPSKSVPMLDALNAHERPLEFGIRAGAPAYWPSGSPAGTVVAKATVGPEVERRSGRRCFELWLVEVKARADLDRRHVRPLCFAPADVAFDPRTRTDRHGVVDWLGLP